MDIATFRATLPEFSNTTDYTDAQVTFYLTQGVAMLRPERWKDMTDQGLLYYTAHNLVLARQRAKSAASGGVPGLTQGVVASKGVDKVNVSYDTQAATLERGGHWNQTTYGVQFLQLARMVGAGPAQVWC